MRKTAMGNAKGAICQRSIVLNGLQKERGHTVTKNKLCNTRDVHCQRSEEVVVATDTDQALGRDGSLEAA
jgi:hypothetical protein